MRVKSCNSSNNSTFWKGFKVPKEIPWSGVSVKLGYCNSISSENDQRCTQTLLPSLFPWVYDLAMDKDVVEIDY